jgi:hypothetical protein
MIIVNRESKDQLYCQKWEFWLTTSSANSEFVYLVFNKYYELERPTKRHNYVAKNIYQRIDTRKNTLSLDQVPLPDEILEEAKSLVVVKVVMRLP